MGIKETKIKRVIDLANLPQKIYHGRKCINWEGSIGKVVEFIYDDINGELEIIDLSSTIPFIAAFFTSVSDSALNIILKSKITSSGE